MERIKAYEKITVPIEIDDKQVDLEIPFELGVLEEIMKLGETLEDFKDESVFSPSAMKLYVKFAKKYIDFDAKKVSPLFPVLFFSSYMRSYMDSLNESRKLTEITVKFARSLARGETLEQDPQPIG